MDAYVHACIDITTHAWTYRTFKGRQKKSIKYTEKSKSINPKEREKEKDIVIKMLKLTLLC